MIALVLLLTGCSGDWSDDGVTEVAEPVGPPRVEHDLTESSRFDASFDCAKASTPSEVAICKNERLSKLDAEMASLYFATLRFTVSGDSTRLRDQRDWLNHTRRMCDAVDDVAACLAARYSERIAEMRALPFETRNPLIGAVEYPSSDASSGLEFVVHLAKACGDATCESTGQISVTKSGATGKSQLIDLPSIFLTRAAGGGLLINSTALYEYQGTINTGDFNFDGDQDFAIQTGNNGSYGGPSYDVFLQDRRSGRFLHAPALSALTVTGLGFFEVDPSARELVEYTKDGCCYHEETHYSVRSNMPTPKRRHVEDATGERLSSYTEVYVNGKWTRTKSQQP